MLKLDEKIKSVNMKMPYNSDICGGWIDLINKAKEVECNYISFCPTITMAEKTSNKIEQETTDSDLKKYINYAKGKGLKIILKPHIRIKQGNLGGSSNICPINISEWINSLKLILLHFVQVFGDDISILSICNECTQQTCKNEDDWINLINAIKERNSNIKLTLAVTDVEIDSNLLYPHVDVLGVNLYLGLNGNKNSFNKDLKKSLYNDYKYKNDYFTKLIKLSQRYDKPILFTEVGCLPYKESLNDPARWSYPEGIIEDEKIQEIYYKTVLPAYLNTSCVLGVSIWSITDNYTFINRKAENIIKDIYKEEYYV